MKKYKIVKDKSYYYTCRDNFISRLFNYSYTLVGVSGTFTDSEEKTIEKLKLVVTGREIVGTMIIKITDGAKNEPAQVS